MNKAVSLTKKHKYRYRDSSCGVTRISVQMAKKHIHKIGNVLSVKGYRFRSIRQYKHDGETSHIKSTREAVLVKGDNGTARFEGFCWGYGGEGPRGLTSLLVLLGMGQAKADYFSRYNKRRDDYQLGIDWELKFR